MENLLLNEELTFPVPTGFHVLDDEEKSRLEFLEPGEGFCLSDPKRHVLSSVGWKPVGALTALVLNASDLAKHAERSVREAMAGMDYRCRGFERGQIAGARAEGFRYAYTAQGVPMIAETWALKRRKCIYYFHFYARAEVEADAAALWDTMLGSVRAAGD